MLSSPNSDLLVSWLLSVYLSDHLRQVHHLTSEEREPWIKAAVFSSYSLYETKHSPFMGTSGIVLHYPSHFISWNTTRASEY